MSTVSFEKVHRGKYERGREAVPNIFFSAVDHFSGLRIAVDHLSDPRTTLDHFSDPRITVDHLFDLENNCGPPF